MMRVELARRIGMLSKPVNVKCCCSLLLAAAEDGEVNGERNLKNFTLFFRGEEEIFNLHKKPINQA